MGLSSGSKVFFCHGSDSRMTERAPSGEWGGEENEEDEEDEEKGGGVQGVQEFRSSGVQEFRSSGV